MRTKELHTNIIVVHWTSFYKLLTRKSQEISQTTEAVAIALGFRTEPDRKTLLLKPPHFDCTREK